MKPFPPFPLTAIVAVLLITTACGPSEKSSPASKSTPPAARILNFYASPPTITRGDKTLLCYGVEFAPWVKLDPPVEKLSPALARCFEVSPAATTRYTLSVPDASQAVEVTVQPPGKAVAAKPSLIDLFLVEPAALATSGKVMLCFGVKNAKSVRITPPGLSYPPSARLCSEQVVDRTTTFQLEVEGHDGAVERQQQTVKVAN